MVESASLPAKLGLDWNGPETAAELTSSLLCNALLASRPATHQPTWYAGPWLPLLPEYVALALLCFPRCFAMLNPSIRTDAHDR